MREPPTRLGVRRLQAAVRTLRLELVEGDEQPRPVTVVRRPVVRAEADRQVLDAFDRVVPVAAHRGQHLGVAQAGRWFTHGGDARAAGRRPAPRVACG